MLTRTRLALCGMMAVTVLTMVTLAMVWLMGSGGGEGDDETDDDEG